MTAGVNTKPTHELHLRQRLGIKVTPELNLVLGDHKVINVAVEVVAGCGCLRLRSEVQRHRARRCHGSDRRNSQDAVESEIPDCVDVRDFASQCLFFSFMF